MLGSESSHSPFLCTPEVQKVPLSTAWNCSSCPFTSSHSTHGLAWDSKGSLHYPSEMHLHQKYQKGESQRLIQGTLIFSHKAGSSRGENSKNCASKQFRNQSCCSFYHLLLPYQLFGKQVELCTQSKGC